MRFAFYEIRPAVDFGDHTESFLGEPQDNGYGDQWYTPEAAYHEARIYAEPGYVVVWTLYGISADTHEAEAIGDFKSFDAALEVLNAILAPLADARDRAWEAAINQDHRAPDKIGDDLDDIINQSTNNERL